ncbi:uncharacterized protein LOC110444813 [Mizuhopecten yessoensis]|nr:uncharacterized protein LOC110444813 [Mizuhopecten yessoensis]
MFTTQIYTYEQNPSCSLASPNCGSLYLSCDLSQGIAQCMPAATEVSNAAPVQPPQAGFGDQNPFGATGPNQFGPAPNTGMGIGGGFGPPMPMFGRRKRQADRKNIAQAKKVLRENARNMAVQKGTHTCTGTWLSFSSQNTFEVDGVSDTRNWVFIPVKIISKRSPEHRKFQAFPIFDGRASRDYDIYDPEAYPEISPYFSEQVMPLSTICNSRATDRTVGRVHVRSNGLNYHGNYEEYTVVDLRQAFSESSTYIALKDPEDDMSEVILTAYDSCGRRCKPYCRSSDPKRPGYHSCSGALRVTKGTPWMYGKNYGDAVRMSWNIQSLTDIPELKADYYFIQFYCDHTD